MPNTPRSITLRRARRADVPALAALEQASFDTDRLSRRQLAVHAAGRSRSRFIVAARGREILGNALVLFRANSHRAKLYSMVVASDARGLGIATRLLARVERDARAHGAREILLEVQTRNRAAVALYQSRGYSRIGERPGFYENGDDAWIFRKTLART